MKIGRISIGALFLAAPLIHAQSPQNIDGLWDATLKQGNLDIPFKIGFSGTGTEVKGWFFNGEEKLVSSGGTYDNGALVLNFDSYLGVLKLNLKDGQLEGDWSTSRNGKTSAPSEIHAVRDTPEAASSTKAPNVDGIWVIENVRSSKGE